MAEWTGSIEKNPWDQILGRLAAELNTEDFRHWFGPTAYASDSGDQISVWVPSESIRRHIQAHFQEAITRALEALGRSDTHVKLIVAGFGEDEDGDEER
jgi:chromosomal replication initiation ATPase DnaA